ncbi:MAG: hypothetical protein GY737_29355 [Desulfobacteraceae bacterium]|nr:hypothetical protein [Desulfobacteraceae bacterium]
MALKRIEYFKKQVFRNWNFLESLAGKRFPHENLAHEAFLYLVNRLEEGEWERVRAFRGDSGFKTFLAVVSRRILEDFSREKFGRFRPPLWLKKQGVLFVEVFRMLCHERLTVSDVVHTLADPRQGLRDPAVVEEAVAVILARITDCGQYRGEPLPTDMETLESHRNLHPELHQLTPEAYLSALERVGLIELIGHCLIHEPSATATATATAADGQDRLGPLVQDFLSRLQMTSEERLLLKAVYQDGLTVTGAGRLLGWNRNQASGRHRRLMERIHGALEQSGLARELKNILD